MEKSHDNPPSGSQERKAMNATLTTMGYVLADYYVGGTLLLGSVLIVLSRIKQPTQRLAVARTTLLALTLLAVLFTVPGWPRFSLLQPEPNQTNSTPGKEAQDTAGPMLSA